MMAHGKPVILAEALNAGKEVFELARQSLDTFPPAPDTPAPATLSDAQQLVIEKQQALLHKEPKPKQKKREQTPGEVVFPGARIGGANGNSAYWTLVEEYFRDVTQQDVLNLLSFCIDPDEDDALLVPQLGRPAEDAKQPQPPNHLPSATAAIAAKASPSPASGAAAAAAADVDDGHEPKRSSRLSAKAQRRQEFGYSRYSDGMTSSADQFSREPQGIEAAAPLVPQLSSPYCLLEQLPAADLLLMVNVSMLLQQLSATDLAAALSPHFTAGGLAALLQQAQQPQNVLHAHETASKNAADLYDDGHRASGMQAPRSSYGSITAMGAYGTYSSGQKPLKSHRQKEKDAAAANAWACVSAGLGGPQLTEQQRAALVAWLQRHCHAPGVGDGRRGPIATPWAPPVPVAVQSDAGVASDAVQVAAAASDEQQQQQKEQELQALIVSHPKAAADIQQETAESADAAVLGLMDSTHSDAVKAADVVVADQAHDAADVAAADMQQQAVHSSQQQGNAVAAAITAAAAVPAVPVPVADPEVVIPVDPYEENLVRLEADAKRRTDRRAAEVARRRLEARLELHPYVKALLHRPLPAHIADPGWDIQENLLGDDEPDDTAAAGSAAAVTTAAAAHGRKAATPAVSSTSRAAAAGESSGVAGDDDAAAEDTAGLPPTGLSGKANRGNSKSRNRGRGRGSRKSGAGRGGKAAGAGAAGNAAGGAGAMSATGAGAADGRGLTGKAEEKAPSSAAAHAVAAVIAAAPSEGSLEEQWPLLDSSADVLALAPDDEVLAELLTLQGELLQQVAINRARLGVVLQAALSDLPNQKAAQAERAKWEDDIVAYMTAVREARKAAKREKRELERRQAVEEAAAMLPLSPRHTAARAARAARENSYGRSSLRGSEWVGGSDDLDDDDDGVRGVSPAGARGGVDDQTAADEVLGADGGPLMDTLSSRDNDDALCSICGEGHSEPPNQILFCERCDVAVHQICYGVDVIPDGEWLCWPCAQYEEQMRRQGVGQADIRPPRWQLGAGGGGSSGGSALTGGSRSVKCALCPMQCGAYKQVTDGTKRWVHVVCALWHPETKMPLDVDEPAIITGIEQLEGRLANPAQQLCQVCRRAVGATVKCSFGHCAATFHPLCGRARGWYLAIRAGGKGGSYLYKAYCAQHSEAQRQKDREAAERAAALAQAVLPVPEFSKPRRGRPPAGAYNLDDYDEAAEQQQQQQQQEAEAAAPVSPAVEIDPAVLQALAVKEQKIWVLQGVRFELETLRMLADQVKRREKVKVQLAKMASEVHTARLEDPATGLQTLEEEMQEHAAILAALPAAAAEPEESTAIAAAEDAAVAEPAVAAAAGHQQSSPVDALGPPVAAADISTDQQPKQQAQAQQQQAGESINAPQSSALVAAADATGVAPKVGEALDVLHALAGGEPAAPQAGTPAAATPVVPEAAALAQDVPLAEQPVVSSAAASGASEQPQGPDDKDLATAPAPLAAGVAVGDLAVTSAEQQQEAAEPPLLESPTGTANNRGSRKASAAAATAVADAAADAAPKSATGGSKGRGKPPRQPTAGNKRGRAAAAAAVNPEEQRSVLPEAAEQSTAAADAQDLGQAQVAVTAGSNEADVPVPVSASAKRRRTGGAGGKGKRGAAVAAAWKGASDVLDGDAAAAAAGGAAAVAERDKTEAIAGGEDKAAAAAAAGQQDTAAADAAGMDEDNVPDKASTAAAGQQQSPAAAEKAAAPSKHQAAADSKPAESAADAVQQQQPTQQAAPPAAGSSRTSSRKRTRASNDDQTLTTNAAADTAAADIAAAAVNPDESAAAGGQLSKAPSTASEDLAAAAASGGGGGGASGSSKGRRGRKELQLLRAQLDHSMFQPVEGARSRRSSRDGGGAAAAADSAAAGPHKAGLSTIAEEDAAGNAAAAAIAESFAADHLAVGNGPVAADAQPAAAAESSPVAAAAAVASPKGQQSGGGGKRQRVSKGAKGAQQQQRQTSPDGAPEAAGQKNR